MSTWTKHGAGLRRRRPDGGHGASEAVSDGSRASISRIALTGASSGIGRALALVYAGPGVTLALFGRDAARLQAVGDAARRLGADVSILTVDVRDRIGMAAALSALDQEAPLDLVIACAGVSSGRTPDGALESAEAAHAVFDVNVIGVVNTVAPALQAMATHGRGRIAIVGSLAASSPLPFAPAYSASKTAVEVWGATLRAAARPLGVGVSVISPGYVSTPMSERVIGPKPFLIDVDEAARTIRRGLDRGCGHIVFPWPLAVLATLSRLLPGGLRERAVGLFAFKVAPN